MTAREVWIAPRDLKTSRAALGLTIEQAAARIAAAAHDQQSPRALHARLVDIEAGRDGWVTIAQHDAILRGLGMRRVERMVTLQPALLAGAARRAGLGGEPLIAERLADFAEANDSSGSDLDAALLAVEAVFRLGAPVPEVPLCPDGDQLTRAFDQHVLHKHNGTGRANCSKCANLLTRINAHEIECERCAARAAWWSDLQCRRERLHVPLEAAKMIAAVLGVQLFRLSAATSNQRRQLYGVSA